MIFLGVLLGVGIMAGTIYMALNKKSSPAVRIACLIAVGIMVLTVIICLFVILTDNRVPVDESILIVGAPVEVKKENTTNIMILVMLIIILLSLFMIVLIFTFKENKKHKSKSAEEELSNIKGLDFLD